MSSNNLFNLEGKVALITGGNGGIGLGIATGIAKSGGDVCIWGRNKEKNEKAIQTLKDLNASGKYESFVCDVSNEAEVNKYFELTLKSMGRVDGCFANAGIGGVAPLTEMSFDEWKRVMSINLDGVFLTLRAAAKHMVERSKNGDSFGRLIATSSTSSIMGAARSSHYGTTKSAVNGFSKALAVEYARFGITSNTIIPGWIESEMTASLNNEKFNKHVISRVPLKRWGNIADFEGIAAYIMSNASSFHTGDEFLLDGGYTNF
jgi:hypothetical protein